MPQFCNLQNRAGKIYSSHSLQGVSTNTRKVTAYYKEPFFVSVFPYVQHELMLRPYYTNSFNNKVLLHKYTILLAACDQVFDLV